MSLSSIPGANLFGNAFVKNSAPLTTADRPAPSSFAISAPTPPPPLLKHSFDPNAPENANLSPDQLSTMGLDPNDPKNLSDAENASRAAKAAAGALAARAVPQAGYGRAATILTSPVGLVGSPSLARQTLLGR